VRGAISAEHGDAPLLVIPIFRCCVSTTSREDGKDGQLELPTSTMAKRAPPSSHPAVGKGQGWSGEDGSTSAVMASAGRPPRRTDSAIDSGGVDCGSAVGSGAAGPASAAQPATAMTIATRAIQAFRAMRGRVQMHRGRTRPPGAWARLPRGGIRLREGANDPFLLTTGRRPDEHSSDGTPSCASLTDPVTVHHGSGNLVQFLLRRPKDWNVHLKTTLTPLKEWRPRQSPIVPRTLSR
jgi:hypothetical protein